MTRLRRMLPLAVLGAAVSIVLAPIGQAGGETPITTCGQVVATDAFLMHDLTCQGRPGVVVSASGITIDLNGFALQGDHSSGRYGVDDVDGFDGVTVENGVLRDFDYGLVGFGANRLQLSSLVASEDVDAVTAVRPEWPGDCGGSARPAGGPAPGSRLQRR